MNARLVELKAFVRFLEEECGFVFDVNRFDHRIKLQKYAFIAMFLGWNARYPYNLYIRGPYSPDLAKDYYGLGDTGGSAQGGECLVGLPKDVFRKIILGKEIEWLEVGTTMLSIYDNIKYKMDADKIASTVIERTKNIKSEYDKNHFIEGIFEDLLKYHLLSLS